MDLSIVQDVAVFENQVGSEFHIELDSEQSVSAELIEATEFDGQNKNADATSRVPFSLLFAVRDGTDLPQRIYRVSHDVLGDLQLFLVPLGGGQSESVFN